MEVRGAEHKHKHTDSRWHGAEICIKTGESEGCVCAVPLLNLKLARSYLDVPATDSDDRPRHRRRETAKLPTCAGRHRDLWIWTCDPRPGLLQADAGHGETSESRSCDWCIRAVRPREGLGAGP